VSLFAPVARRLLERRSLPDEEWLREALGGKLTAAGVRVNEKTALTISAVWQCVDILAKNIGTLPLPIYRETDTGRERARKHPLWKVLNRKANPWMTAVTFRMAMAIHLALWQAFYAHIERDGYGNVLALWPLMPDRTKPVTKGDKLVFETTLADGTIRTLSADEVLYIPGLTINGLESLPTIKMAREVLGLLLAMQEHAGRHFSNGANPGGIATTDKPLNKEERKQLAEEIKEQVGGLAKVHELLVLSYGVKFTPIGINPQNSQLLESRQFQILEVARWFNMPPHKLGIMDKGGASYASVEQMNIQFVVETLRPPLVMIEQAMMCSLLRDDEAEVYTIEHVLEGLLRGDSKSRGEFYYRMWLMGVYSINDILRKENMNTIGPDGDKHWVPANMMPIDQAGNMDGGARAALLTALQGLPGIRTLFDNNGGEGSAD
jgi:HK97 family phage portal protein